jgi:hypothetical protein
MEAKGSLLWSKDALLEPLTTQFHTLLYPTLPYFKVNFVIDLTPLQPQTSEPVSHTSYPICENLFRIPGHKTENDTTLFRSLIQRNS